MVLTALFLSQVYIMDLNSHHGTYLLRTRESVIQPIKPEAHTVLADGDRLIFGKKVGQDSSVVHPITVSVKLLYDPKASSEVVSAGKSSTETPRKLAVKPPSGRYGLPTVSSPSESSPSSSDQDFSESESDIELISSPNLPHRSSSELRSELSHSTSIQPAQSRFMFQSLHPRMAFLRRLLPPIYSSSFSDRPIDVDADEGAANLTALKKFSDVQLKSERAANLTTAWKNVLDSQTKNTPMDVIDVDAPTEPKAGPPMTTSRTSAFCTTNDLLSYQPVMSWPTLHMPAFSHVYGYQGFPIPFPPSSTPADMIAGAREESMELATPEPPQDQDLTIGAQPGNTVVPNVVSPVDHHSHALDVSASSPGVSSINQSVDSNVREERDAMPDGIQSEFDSSSSNLADFPGLSFDFEPAQRHTAFSSNFSNITADMENRLADLSKEIAVVSVSLSVVDS